MIELLDKKHQRENFNCGNELLNFYLKTQANQDIKRKLSVCFVFSDAETHKIKGYYTLSNNSIPLRFFSEEIQKKIPKSYQSLPTILIGRLAVDVNFHGQGLGKLLLQEVETRAKLAQNKFLFLNVNKYNKAKEFYEKLNYKVIKDEVIDIGKGYVMDDYVMEKGI